MKVYGVDKKGAVVASIETDGAVPIGEVMELVHAEFDPSGEGYIFYEESSIESETLATKLNSLYGF